MPKRSFGGGGGMLKEPGFFKVNNGKKTAYI